jgi:hypothetical protein
MKKLSIAFVSVLSLAAFAGCKKGGAGGSDCAGTIGGLVDRMMAEQANDPKMKDMPAEAKKQMEDMVKKMAPKMKEVMIGVCNTDKWSAEALTCYGAAKNEGDAKACDAKLTPEQKKSMDKAEEAAMKDMMGGAMGGDKPAGDKPAGDKPAGDKPAGDKPAEGSAAAPAAAAGDLPAECNDYKAAIEKLAACDKLPQAARDALKQSYDQASASWAGLPAEAKASLATACKAGADAVKQSAAVCN